MALEDHSIIIYECTAEWSPEGEGGILWNDPSLEIEWPQLTPIVSDKDAVLPTMSQWLENPASRNIRFGQ
jgi:dTDP-4-dehydrorhamnose 3,5-epimerase